MERLSFSDQFWRKDFALMGIGEKLPHDVPARFPAYFKTKTDGVTTFGKLVCEYSVRSDRQFTAVLIST